jgi:hypothetical protein
LALHLAVRFNHTADLIALVIINIVIGTHILSESSKDNAQTRYQLNNHLQSNTLELDDKAQTLSYEHYYPYGGTAIIAGTTVAVRVDGEGLLPITTVCLV